MIGFVIGTLLGVIVFILQNFKLTSGGFRIFYLIATILFIVGIYFAKMNYWNLLIIPLGELVLAFISAFLFPFNYYGVGLRPEAVKKTDISKQDNSAMKYLKEYLNAFSNNLEKGSNSSMNDKSVFDTLIKAPIEEQVRTIQSEFCKVYNDNLNTERQWILFQINNISGNELESGKHHLFRGLLNAEGESLFRIFRLSSDEIVKLHVMDGNGNLIDEKWASENLKALQSNIATVG